MKGGEGGDDDGEGEAGGVRGVEVAEVKVRQLDKGCGPCPVGVLGGGACRGSDVASGGPDHQGEEGLPGHWPRRGDVEGSGGDYKSLAHGLHHLPRLPP